MKTPKGVTANLKVWDAIKQAVEVARSKSAKIGIFSARGGDAATKADAGDNGAPLTVLEVARIHAFGTKDIPQRDFINETLRVKRSQIFETQRKAMKGVIMRRFRAETGLEIIGQKVQAEMKNLISEDTHLPALSAATIAAKGSSVPLVDTGQLINSITYEVSE